MKRVLIRFVLVLVASCAFSENGPVASDEVSDGGQQIQTRGK